MSSQGPVKAGHQVFWSGDPQDKPSLWYRLRRFITKPYRLLVNRLNIRYVNIDGRWLPGKLTIGEVYPIIGISKDPDPYRYNDVILTWAEKINERSNQN